MKCPYCGNTDDKVIESRKKGNYQSRKRRCNQCNRVFKTLEYFAINEKVTTKPMPNWVKGDKHERRTV